MGFSNVCLLHVINVPRSCFLGARLRSAVAITSSRNKNANLRFKHRYGLGNWTVYRRAIVVNGISRTSGYLVRYCRF